MSFDIGLICFERGKMAPLPGRIIYRAFAPYVVNSTEGDDEDGYEDADEWRLSFPDGGGGEMEPAYEDDQYADLCITGASGRDIYRAVLEVMLQTHTLLWWHGGPDSMVTADPNIAAHLPPDFIAEHGKPTLVRCTDDILAALAKS